jgi:hypothetical protein
MANFNMFALTKDDSSNEDMFFDAEPWNGADEDLEDDGDDEVRVAYVL